MATCYLDVDDEITGAIARLRSVDDGQAVLVLPAGSRIATSRINFRLLAREATERGLDIVVVSDEPGTRALAISAGLPAYDSTVAAEAALHQFRQQDRSLAERAGGAAAPARGPANAPRAMERTRIMPAGGPASSGAARPVAAAVPDTTIVAGEPASTASRGRRPAPSPAPSTEPAAGTSIVQGPEAAAESAPRARRRGRRLPVVPLVAAALVLLLLAGAAYGAYLLLPTATIAVRPEVTVVGPTELTVVADPRVAVPDAAAGVVPAERLDIQYGVSGTFPATGSQVSQSRASGSVRFRSENTVSDVRVPAGTRVSTSSGVVFETTRAVTLPQASFASGPTTADAPVRALRAGPRGNVAAGAIRDVPGSLAEAQVSVRNPQPTSGGEREEVTVVAAEDYDAALETLMGQLPAELDRVLAEPETTPRGLTAFRASLRTAAAQPVPPAEDLVGTEVTEFRLAVEGSATVLAVNEQLVDEVVTGQLATLLPPGETMAADGVESQRAAGAVVGDTVVYRVSATVATYRLPARDALVEQIRGRSVSEAEAIMAQYGTVEIAVWPEFVDRIPDQPTRINLTIVPPEESP